MSKTKVVLAVVLLLGLGAVATIFTLERRAAKSRDAQVSLANISVELTQLELMPLAGPTLPGSTSQKVTVIESLFKAREQEITKTMARLHRDAHPAALNAADTPLRAAIDTARQAIPIWVPSMPVSDGTTGAPGITSSRVPLLTRQGTTLVAALAALDKANHAYGVHASTLQIEALSGSAAVVAVLLAAFGFFYQRSDASRRELAAQRATLRRALAELEAAQTDRARLLERTVEVAEHERIRVAADLHDGPIQRLSAVTLGFDLLANQFDRGNYERAAQLVDQIRDTLATETVSLRRLMTELRPPILDERGLRAALHDCAEQVFEGSAVDWSVDPAGGVIQLAPEIDTVAYRVVREALVNIRKHAPAAHVTVTIEQTGDCLELTIADDGPGFDEGAPIGYTNGARYGLIGMQERVESVGGKWHLVTAPGEGTRIEVWLPRKLGSSTASLRPSVEFAA